eukprot:TRINITY_DN6282_c0_g1_i1.p1 TRINITY_DN6282_c0_g1~~TRINITY_DN6282_c0_g1_i1.p1  ORF type:complete len:187 (-),score=20.88 TRINITY_DN6282_c0_g1_i1:11-571(-)
MMLLRSLASPALRSAGQRCASWSQGPPLAGGAGSAPATAALQRVYGVYHKDSALSLVRSPSSVMLTAAPPAKEQTQELTRYEFRKEAGAVYVSLPTEELGNLYLALSSVLPLTIIGSDERSVTVEPEDVGNQTKTVVVTLTQKERKVTTVLSPGERVVFAEIIRHLLPRIAAQTDLNTWEKPQRRI